MICDRLLINRHFSVNFIKCILYQKRGNVVLNKMKYKQVKYKIYSVKNIEKILLKYVKV